MPTPCTRTRATPRGQTWKCWWPWSRATTQSTPTSWPSTTRTGASTTACIGTISATSATTTSGTIPWAGTRSRTSATRTRPPTTGRPTRTRRSTTGRWQRPRPSRRAATSPATRPWGTRTRRLRASRAHTTRHRHPFAPAVGPPEAAAPAEAREAAQAPARTCTQECTRRASAARATHTPGCCPPGTTPPRPENWPGITPTG